MRALLLFAGVPLVLVLGLLAIALLGSGGGDGAPAGRPLSTAYAPPGTERVDVGRDALGAAVFRAPGGRPREPGVVVVFLHGWTEVDPTAYGPWISHLVGRGAAVIYPTYQVAPFLDTVTPLANAIAVLPAALSEVRLDRARLVVAGFSAGGALAADLAASAQAAGLPRPAVVYSLYPGRSLPGIPLVIAPVDASNIAAGTRLAVLAGDDDELVGTAVAREIARTATRADVTLRIVRDDAVDDHAAPGRSDPVARRTFWAPLDRLIAATG